ncbi:MAG: phospholipase D-like domain-containing protein [Prevotellaceae bacterium]|nr:phospholipase D-like domain-containing protein [Prevotellaceae bacterium]
MEVLQKGWHNKLNCLFQNVHSELTISSPYISDGGVDFLINAIPEEFKEKGLVKFITNLSSKNIYQGATNPYSFKKIFDNVNLVQIFHLPNLHAKVYIQDNTEAIITSGNLTAGGLFNNYEYGTYIFDKKTVSLIKNDLTDYGNLGALVNLNDILNYCSLTEKVKDIYHKKEKHKNKELDILLNKAINEADEKLIELKITGGKIHPIFEKTIAYILKTNGALEQNDINNLLKEIHPDLCDDVDRIINGVHFGKKWKHAARTAIQRLKKQGLIEKQENKWILLQ